MRLGFCISGAGRMACAILAARNHGILDFERPVFLTDKRGGFYERAKEQGLETIVVERVASEPLYEYKSRINCAIQDLPVEGLFLTFDWLLSPETIARFSPKVLNLHMALLPLFPGKGALLAALSSGMTIAGATIHQVDAGIDTGPILGQVVTPIAPGMDEDALGRDVFKAALPLAIQSVRWLQQGRLDNLEARRVSVSRAKYQPGSACSPSVDADISSFSSSYIIENFA